MPVVWYDNALDADPDDPEWYDIDRIYCFDWDAFSDADWKLLATIYSQLPEPCQTAANSCPRWFAAVDDPKNGYLTASVEPPGLQVFGTLLFTEFQRWHGEFEARIADLPSRTLDDG